MLSRHLIVPLLLVSVLHIHNANGQDNQQTTSNAATSFSGKGFNIESFVTETFNHPNYTYDVFPAYLRDLSALLRQGSLVLHPATYTNALFKLFGNKIKGAPYIGAYGFLEFVEQLPTNLEHLSGLRAFAISPASYYEDLHNLLYDAFLNKFDELKTNPDAFFASLTNNAVSLISQRLSKPSLELSRHETLENVQPMLVRFLELSINKLMWGAQDHKNLWASVKGIAAELETLYDKEFIGDQSDLDDLYWSLIHRFALFIDINSTSLPLDLLLSIQNEINSGTLLLVSLKEQEQFLTTKKEVLDQALTTCITKRMAFDRGIISA